METLNHQQSLRQPVKKTDKTVLNDQVYEKTGHCFMSFAHYSLSGNDLVLTQNRDCDGGIEADDHFRDWKLVNVDQADCDPDKLSRLVDEYYFTDMKIFENGKRKRLIFKSEFERYVFNCDHVEYEIRGYTRHEILEMLNEQSNYLDMVEIENSSLRDFLSRLFRFIHRETIDYRNLLVMNLNNENTLAVKSRHCVELLTRIKDKLNDLKTILPEYVNL